MCLQDVRLGRAKEAAFVGQELTTIAGLTIGYANPNRAALVISGDFGDPATDYARVTVHSRNQSGPMLCVLNAYNPTRFLRLEDYGDGILGPVLVLCDVDDIVTVNVAEVRWNAQPEDIV